MSKRDERLFIIDIIDSTKAILEYIDELDLEKFMHDRKTYSAVIREFEIIGEATKHISSELLSRYTEIEWRDIKDFRNVLIHEYFGIDHEIVWNTIQQDLPTLLKVAEKMHTEIANA